jgi:small-conductance mechanosensitive channel
MYEVIYCIIAWNSGFFTLHCKFVSEITQEMCWKLSKYYVYFCFFNQRTKLGKTQIAVLQTRLRILICFIYIIMLLTSVCIKGKAFPLQAWSGPEGSRKLRFPDFMTTAQDGGKVISLTHRPPLPPGNTPGTHFC